MLLTDSGRTGRLLTILFRGRNLEAEKQDWLVPVLMTAQGSLIWVRVVNFFTMLKLLFINTSLQGLLIYSILKIMG